jgi:lysozyme family protein
MTFDQAIDIVGLAEGGFSTDRDDVGNYTPSGVFKGTKYGISARSYPDLDIKNLSWQKAKEIYKIDFWERYLVGSVAPGIRLFLFDSIINHGPSAGVKLLQRAAGVRQDGKIGPVTISNSWNISPWKFAQVRSDYYVGIVINRPVDIKQLKGWLRRNLHILERSIQSNSVPV